VKLLLENWREYISSLTEAELRYSKDALEEILAWIQEGDLQEERSHIVYLPDDILYSDNEYIDIGQIILKNWHFGGKASRIFVKTKCDPKSGGFGSAYWLHSEKISVPVMTINTCHPLAARQNAIKFLKSVIRHELQHITQMINGTALEYGQNYIKNNRQFDKVEKINPGINWRKKEFGTPGAKTGFDQGGSQLAPGQHGPMMSPDEISKRYLGDDFEYETWKSDLLDRYVDTLATAMGRKFNTALMWAAWKMKYPQLNENSSSIDTQRREILGLAKQMEVTPRDLIKFMKTKQDFNTLAGYWGRLFLEDPEWQKTVESASGMQIVKAIRTILKLRPREFRSDFIKDLELRFQELAKENGYL
jgi:hypothetical protein